MHNLCWYYHFITVHFQRFSRHFIQTLKLTRPITGNKKCKQRRPLTFTTVANSCTVRFHHPPHLSSSTTRIVWPLVGSSTFLSFSSATTSNSSTSSSHCISCISRVAYLVTEPSVGRLLSRQIFSLFASRCGGIHAWLFEVFGMNVRLRGAW